MLDDTLQLSNTDQPQPAIQSNRYCTIINKMQNAVLLFDSTMSIVDRNESARHIEGELISDIIPSLNMQALEALCHDTCQDQTLNGEFNTDQNSNKSYFEFEIHTNIEPEMHLAILRNITKYKNLELEKSKVAAKFKSIADHVPDCFWSTSINEKDHSYEVLYVSPGWKEIWGYEPEDIYRDPTLWTRLILPEFRENAAKINAEVIKGKKRKTTIYPIKNKKNEIRWIEDRATPVLNDKNELIGIDGIARDITKQRLAEEKLQQHLAELAHVSRLNIVGEMTSCIAHEINQPLSAIINYAGGCLNRSNNENPQVIEAIKKIIYQAEYAGKIIHRLKNFLRKNEIQKQRCEVNSLIEEALLLVEFELSAKNINLELDLAAEKLLATADKIQIQQVILCIIRNAIEAMHAENITQPSIKINSQLSSSGLIQVSITDNGRGIPEKIRKRIFDIFFTTKKTGMGIGLAIAKSITEMHGGQIWLNEALPESGSQFCFTLTQQEK